MVTVAVTLQTFMLWQNCGHDWPQNHLFCGCNYNYGLQILSRDVSF